jgi:hypothetical protein
MKKKVLLFFLFNAINLLISCNGYYLPIKREMIVLDSNYHVEQMSSLTIPIYLNSGQISGYFSVSSDGMAQKIDFYIFDQPNFDKWKSGLSAYSVVSFTYRSYSTFSFSIPTSGYYYIILDNSFSIFKAKDVHIYLKATY